MCHKTESFKDTVQYDKLEVKCKKKHAMSGKHFKSCRSAGKSAFSDFSWK